MSSRTRPTRSRGAPDTPAELRARRPRKVGRAAPKGLGKDASLSRPDAIQAFHAHVIVGPQFLVLLVANSRPPGCKPSALNRVANFFEGGSCDGSIAVTKTR